MKKLYLILIPLLLIFILAACDAEDDKAGPKEKQSSSSSEEEMSEASTSGTSDSSTSSDAAALIGKWHTTYRLDDIEYDITLTLDSEDDFTYDEWNKNDDSQTTISGTYETGPGTLTLDSGSTNEGTVLPESPVKYDYTLESDHLKLTADGTTLDFTKE